MLSRSASERFAMPVGDLCDQLIQYVPMGSALYGGAPDSLMLRRTKRAPSRPLNEIFDHVHGNHSPLRRGQDDKLLTCPPPLGVLVPNG
jgi:hypothetical protein